MSYQLGVSGRTGSERASKKWLPRGHRGNDCGAVPLPSRRQGHELHDQCWHNPYKTFQWQQYSLSHAHWLRQLSWLFQPRPSHSSTPLRSGFPKEGGRKSWLDPNMPLRMKALFWRLPQKLGPPSRTKKNEALPRHDRTQLGLRSCKKLGNGRPQFLTVVVFVLMYLFGVAKTGKQGKKSCRKLKKFRFAQHGISPKGQRWCIKYRANL